MDVADCPELFPSLADMHAPFERYIERLEPECLEYGICKITAPAAWTPRARGYNGEDLDCDISRIQQHFTRETMASGIYTAEMAPLRKQTVRAFRQATELPNEKRLRAPAQHLDDLSQLESAYWRTIPGCTEYGADNEGSLFDDSVREWNPAKLDSCLSRGLAADPSGSGQTLKGVNTPYLYYGRWKATFAWHTEDFDLHSVNYLHYGAPKVWYCVPPKDRSKMDAFVARRLYSQHGRCREFMRHKTVLIKPEELKANGIEVHKVVQHPGDFIINFPGAYHSGFNVGFNCAESTNFATKSWIAHGAVAKFCSCTPHQESVRLDMGLFLDQAPNEEVRQLVLKRMAQDRQARGEPLDEASEADAASGSGSDAGSCTVHQVKRQKVKGPASKGKQQAQHAQQADGVFKFEADKSQKRPAKKGVKGAQKEKAAKNGKNAKGRQQVMLPAANSLKRKHGAEAPLAAVKSSTAKHSANQGAAQSRQTKHAQSSGLDAAHHKPKRSGKSAAVVDEASKSPQHVQQPQHAQHEQHARQAASTAQEGHLPLASSGHQEAAALPNTRSGTAFQQHALPDAAQQSGKRKRSPGMFKALKRRTADAVSWMTGRSSSGAESQQTHHQEPTHNQVQSAQHVRQSSQTADALGSSTQHAQHAPQSFQTADAPGCSTQHAQHAQQARSAQPAHQFQAGMQKATPQEQAGAAVPAHGAQAVAREQSTQATSRHVAAAQQVDASKGARQTLPDAGHSPREPHKSPTSKGSSTEEGTIKGKADTKIKGDAKTKSKNKLLRPKSSLPLKWKSGQKRTAFGSCRKARQHAPESFLLL